MKWIDSSFSTYDHHHNHNHNDNHNDDYHHNCKDQKYEKIVQQQNILRDNQHKKH